MEQKIHPAQIGFDFDGVIADTAEAFIRIACEQYDYCGIELDHITRFEVEECTELNFEIVEEIFTRILHDSVGTQLMPMAGAIRVLEELSIHAPVTIITARPLAEPVHRWMEKHMPSPLIEQIRLVAMGDHDDKARHVRQLNLSHFIDDRAETCQQLEQAGVRSILFSQPWNRSHTTLPAVQNWEEIRALCL